MKKNKSHKERIIEAQKAIEKVKDKVSHSLYRQKYHFVPPAGWINDPNGFVQYNGQYHLFYQHNPYSAEWATMHWGHAVSNDLLNWIDLPIALAPSEDYDYDEKGGCFSGSAVDDNGTLTLIYTGCINEAEGTVQSQCIATSEDGINFEKYEKNPVIPAFPKDGERDFRDPKVWKENNEWYTVVGTTKNDNGRALLYKSKDLREWSYVGVLAESDGSLGYIWECPDFFKLGDKYVLILSPTRLGEVTTLYLVGDMDYSIGKFTWHTKGQIDYGTDFYAPQTLLDDKGRRIMIGWANSWKHMPWFNGFGPSQKNGWNGSMSVPRVLTLDSDNKIIFTPIEEIENIRQNNITNKNVIIDKNNLILESNNNECYDIEFNIDLKKTSAKKFIIKLRQTDTGFTNIEFDLSKGIVGINRDNSDEYSKGIKNHDINLEGDNLYSRILSDTTSIELFTENNKVVMSSNIYPVNCNNQIELISIEGDTYLENINIWDLNI